MKKNANLGLLILRICISVLMLFHGVAKMVHGISFLTEKMGFWGYAVYVGEILAPLIILFGWRTRIGSAIYVINCIVAIAFAHADDLFALGDHGGYANELLMLYLFGAGVLFFTGAGSYAVSTQNNWD